VQGVALDAWFQNPIGEDAARVVKPGGRIVAPVGFDTPQQMAVLAHDENYWVAEKPGEVIALRRAKLSQ
jgi:protein-L-isoaspartate O-methyltransferase